MAGDDERMDRRRFFREGLGRLLGQVQKAAEPVARFAREMEKLESPPPSGTPAAPARPVTLPLLLRPPGALPEAEFAAACSRCGLCVKACPVECIRIDGAPGNNPASGFPHVIAEAKACVACEDLSCMKVCPTGALQLVPRATINMGRAVWGQGKCVRPDGDECTRCVEACPMGTAAIDVDGPEGIVVKDGCIGCGSCQHACPTTPRAIVVVPRR